jgi:hypothetical protein
MVLLHLVTAVAAFLGTIIKHHKEMASKTDGARFMAATLS